MTKRSLLMTLLLGLAGCAAAAGGPADAGSDGGSSADGGTDGGSDGGCATNADCASGSYCAGDGCGTEGSCAAIPASCPPFVQLVCGCDGMTYDNACKASLVGVRISVAGACPTAQCTAVLQQIQTLAGQVQSCSANSDCVVDRVPCGVGPCWAALNTAGDSQLSSLLTSYVGDDHCGSGVACACTPLPASASCDGGVCQAN